MNPHIAQRPSLLMFLAVISMTLSVLLGIVMLVRGSVGVNEPLESPRNPSAVGPDGGIEIRQGDAVQIDFYYDYTCDECAEWDSKYVQVLRDTNVLGGKTIAYHPLTLFDAASAGSDYSTRAAGAAYCAADGEPETFTEVHRQLFASRPRWGNAGPRNDVLIAALVTAGGGPAMSQCISQDKFEAYAQQMTDQLPRRQAGDIPRIEIGGEVVEPWELNPTDLRRKVWVAGGVLPKPKPSDTDPDNEQFDPRIPE